MFASRYLPERERESESESESEEVVNDVVGSGGRGGSESSLNFGGGANDEENREDEQNEDSTDENSDASDENSDKSSDNSDTGSENKDEFNDEEPNIILSEESTETPQLKRKYSNDSTISSNGISTNDKEEQTSKHASIFKRLRVATASQDIAHESSDSSDSEAGEALVPIPQPELPKDKRVRTKIPTSLNWIAKPQNFSSESSTSFKDLFENRSQRILENLTAAGFQEAFAVQKVVFKKIRNTQGNSPDNPGDLLVNAATGSGKTIAYLAPILSSLYGRIVPKLSCIILVPTRPLITQVLHTATVLSKGTSLRITGSNVNISVAKEIERFAQFKPDIIVSTPGRLVDYLSLGSSSFSLKYLRFLVIDEVDKLLTQQFQNWIDVINQGIKANKNDGSDKSFNYDVQKLLFSATLHNDVTKLAKLGFCRPQLLVVGDDKDHRSTTNTNTEESTQTLFKIPRNIKEHELFIPSELASFKPLILFNLLTTSLSSKPTLVFTKSNEFTLRLAKLLELLAAKTGKNLSVEHLNSMISANNKRKILNKFTNNKIQVLVVTDLVSRGLDLANIDEVINYDLPSSAVDYVHRVGRCGRAYKSGESLSILEGIGERRWFNKTMKNIGRVVGIENMEMVDISEQEKKFYEECLGQMRGEN